MPEEGIASTESAEPSTSLGGETAQSAQVDTSASDVWGQLSQGGDANDAASTTDTGQAPVVVADPPPAGEAAPQAAAEPVKPADGSTAVEEDPFDKILDPKRDDFQAIRADRKAVVAKLKEAEPLAAAVEQIGGAEVLGMVAPLFQPFADLPTGLQTARDFTAKIGEFDPQVDKVLKEAMYERHKDTYYGWALQDNGIQPEDFKAFQDFRAGGGQVAGQGYQGIPHQGFPEPDHDGFVQLPDGTVLDTANDAGHKVAYDLAKKDFNREQADNNQKAATAAEQRTAAQARDQQERDGRVSTFIKERDTVFDDAFSKLTIDCGPDTEDAKELITAMVVSAVGKNKELPALAREANRLAAEGGNAAASKGLAIDRIGLKALAEATEKVTNLYRELHQLRQQVQGGRPQIPGQQPSNVQPSTFKPNDTPPPVSPGRDQNDAVDDIWKQVSGGS